MMGVAGAMPIFLAENPLFGNKSVPVKLVYFFVFVGK